MLCGWSWQESPQQRSRSPGSGRHECEGLGWTARTSFEALVAEMASQDLNEACRDALVTKHGYTVCQNNE